MVFTREVLGTVIRDYRVRRNLTLREVAMDAHVALGYLSEIERGHKEASSEVLQRIATAMNEPLSQILVETGERLVFFEELEYLTTSGEIGTDAQKI